MNAINQSHLLLIAPELALTFLILTLLFLDLAGKWDGLKFVRGALLGCFFILLVVTILWPRAGRAFNEMLELNRLATFFKIIFLASGMLILAMAREYMKTLGSRANDFVLLILVALVGAFFLSSANDLITLFISIEWMTITLYILTAYLKSDPYALEAGTKYLIMGAFSAALLLYGISLVYGSIGAVRFHDIRQELALRGADPLFSIGFFLILAGLGFKIAAFPFQLWVPDVYEGAPTPITAFLSVVSKTACFAALLKVLFLVGEPNQMNWPVFIGVLSAATMTYGNLGALAQTNMKRLFAYSSIGHAGYLLMGIACGTRFGVEATLFYVAAYAVSNLTAFLVIVIANRELASGEISDYRGLAKKEPVLAATFFLALLSLGGIPPLAGFFAKFLVLQAAVLRGYLWLALIGAVNVIVSLYYYLSVIKQIYFKETAGGEGTFELRRSAKVLLVFLALGIVFIGIVQEPVLYLARSGASTLF